MQRRVVIAAGGTGGHLFPAQRLAKALKTYDPALHILLMGSGLNASPFVDNTMITTTDVEAYPWKGILPQHVMRFCFRNLKGVAQACNVLKKYNPSALIGFGSYHTVPVMAAACMKNIPYMLYEANSIPGKAVKLFSSRAKMTAVQFPETGSMLKGKTLQVSMGGKFSRFRSEDLRREALEYFGLSGLRTILLISGGSQGAKSINDLICTVFRQFPRKGIQVIHLAGKEADLEHYRSVYSEQGIVACVKAFEERMDLAWSVANLFLGRAGAGTIAEILQSCVPAILIPYPYASDGHQTENARFITEEVKAGIYLPQFEATPEKLNEALEKAISHCSEWRLVLQTYTAEIKLPSLEETVIDFLSN